MTIFKSQKTISIFTRIKDFIWPRIGFMRSFRYTGLRIVRLSDSIHNIALGLCIGLGVSFTPLIGTHFLQAAAGAYITRANMLASLIGTLLGNPWTFPFMFTASYKAGEFLFKKLGFTVVRDDAAYDGFPVSELIHHITHEPLTLFLPWVVGGYICCFISIILAYPLFFFAVKISKQAKERLKASKFKIHSYSNHHD